MCQHLIPFTRSTGGLLPLEQGESPGEICRRHPEASRSFIEKSGGAAVEVRIGHQGQIMGQVGPLAGKASAFGCDGDAVGQGNGV